MSDAQQTTKQSAALKPGDGMDAAHPDRAVSADAGQLGLLFEQPSEPVPPKASAEKPATHAPKRSLTPRLTRKAGDTLPAWARASMPSAALSTPPGLEKSSFDEDEVDENEEPTRRVWRVAELVSEVRTHIESAYADLWVRGEISNLRAAPSGHLYFTLKDGDSQLPAVLFRRQAQLLRFRPEDGLEVLLRGRVSVYEQRGQMQLIAEYLEPVGAGSLQLAFEQLKRRLEAEGLFAMDRKRQLPAYPRCIGIVTSPSGAVIRDFLNVAGRRHALLDVLLYPAMVQGEQAASEIAAAIAYFNRERSVDVIVIARGGGSLEDLAPFNSEAVARAIAASTLPVVSAVGHETDFTIADFVADLRAPTPSAAAELITAAQHRIEERLEELHLRMARAMRYSVSIAQQRFTQVSIEASFARLRDSLGRREQRVDEQRFRLERAQALALRAASDQWQRASAKLQRQNATERLHRMRERFASLQLRIERAATQRFLAAREQQFWTASSFGRHDPSKLLYRLQQQHLGLAGRLGRSALAALAAARQKRAAGMRALDSLSPLAVLGRGYSVAYAADGLLLSRVEDAHIGDAIQVRMATGTLGATVTTTDTESMEG